MGDTFGVVDGLLNGVSLGAALGPLVVVVDGIVDGRETGELLGAAVGAVDGLLDAVSIGAAFLVWYWVAIGQVSLVRWDDQLDFLMARLLAVLWTASSSGR
jgi:hypothetical protein